MQAAASQMEHGKITLLLKLKPDSFSWVCIWLMQLGSEYWCAQAEVEDSCVIFSMSVYMYICVFMCTTDIANKKCLHLVPKK